MTSYKRSAIALATCVLLAFPALSSGAVYVFTGSQFLAAFACFSSLIIGVVIARYVLVTPQQSKYIAATSVALHGVSLAAIITLSNSSVSWHITRHIIAQNFPSIDLPERISDGVSQLIVAFAILATTTVIAAMMMRSSVVSPGTQRKATRLTDRQVESITRLLEDHLSRLDESLRFFDFRNSAINPDLEVINIASRYSKSLSPIRVLSRAKEWELVVVRGEPGSGKSVMLRSLTQSLLAKTRSGGKIPLLVNLRDWELPPPAGVDLGASLAQWIRKEFCSRLVGQSPALSGEQFDRLYLEGAFVFLLDSFDEISLVNEAEHNADEVRAVSTAVTTFIRSSGGCIGLLFSREFKSPVLGWVDHSPYVIKPFTDSNVKQYVHANCRHATVLLSAIMNSRPDLFAIARSPLLLALLVDYCNRNDGQLPGCEFDLFNAFVLARMRSARNLIAAHHSEHEVLEFAKNLADKIRAQARSGANAIVTTEAERLSFAPNLEVLVAARLARVTGDTISFSHRRIQEYFLVLRMIDRDDKPPAFSIDRMSSDRDALILYAQICDTLEAERLALAAYGCLRRSFKKVRRDQSQGDYIRVILAFRFLRYAFRNRQYLIYGHRRGLAYWTVELWNSGDTMRKKHAVENVSLVPNTTAASLIRQSLKGDSGWLRSTSLAEARYLLALRTWLGRAITSYTTRLDDGRLLIECVKRNISAPIANADWIDRLCFALDLLLRVTVISLFVCAIHLKAPLPSMGVFLLVLYLGILIVCSRLSSNPFDLMMSPGLNSGISGLVGYMMFIGASFDIAFSAIGGGKFFWSSSNSGASIALLFGSLMMLGNCSIVRARDLEDRIGKVPILPKGLMPRANLSWRSSARFIKEHIFLITIFLAGIASLYYRDAAYVAVGLFGGWLIYMLGVVALALLRWVRDLIVERIEKGQVDQFGLHFSGKRTEIAAALAAVRTYRSKRKILRVADRKSLELPTVMFDPNNEWVEGARPALDDPILDGYLAMLEERWRGLS